MKNLHRLLSLDHSFHGCLIDLMSSAPTKDEIEAIDTIFQRLTDAYSQFRESVIEVDANIVDQDPNRTEIITLEEPETTEESAEAASDTCFDSFLAMDPVPEEQLLGVPQSEEEAELLNRAIGISREILAKCGQYVDRVDKDEAEGLLTVSDPGAEEHPVAPVPVEEISDEEPSSQTQSLTEVSEPAEKDDADGLIELHTVTEVAASSEITEVSEAVRASEITENDGNGETSAPAATSDTPEELASSPKADLTALDELQAESDEYISLDDLSVMEMTVPEPSAADSAIRVDEMLSRRTTSDLRKAFTLNDKYRFRRELFGNNDADMTDTLNILSAMHSLVEAEDYLYGDLGWDASQIDVKDFMSVVKSHFDSKQ